MTGWRPAGAQGWKHLAFMLPALTILGVFHVWAGAFTVLMSFTNWSLGRVDFVAWLNYGRLASDARFLNALGVTGWFVLGSVPATIVLSVPLAYVLYFILQRTHVYRLALFLPYVTPTVATSMIWGLLFSPSPFGLANTVLTRFGLPQQRWLLEPAGVLQLLAHSAGVMLPHWAQGPSLAMTVVLAARVWQMLGFTIVILLAGLTNIDPHVVEAARIDGAKEHQVLARVIAPMLSPTLLFVSVMSFIFAIREFNTIYVLTNGGPVGTTQTLTMLVFKQVYEDNQLGYGATTATVLFMIVLAVTWLQFRYGERLVTV